MSSLRSFEIFVQGLTGAGGLFRLFVATRERGLLLVRAFVLPVLLLGFVALVVAGRTGFFAKIVLLHAERLF